MKLIFSDTYEQAACLAQMHKWSPDEWRWLDHPRLLNWWRDAEVYIPDVPFTRPDEDEFIELLISSNRHLIVGDAIEAI